MIVSPCAYQQPFSAEISSNFSLFMHLVAHVFSLRYLKAIVGEDQGHCSNMDKLVFSKQSSLGHLLLAFNAFFSIPRLIILFPESPLSRRNRKVPN